MKPLAGTFPSYYHHYIELVKQENVMDALKHSHQQILQQINAIPPEKEDFAYAAGKWTSKALVTHITDTERILSYRALRFARNDARQPLPFDEDHYAEHAGAGSRTVADLSEEFDSVRKATLTLYKNFSDQVLLRSGQTSIGQTTVLALGFMICGHGLHHCNILAERYLKNSSSIKI